MNDVKTLADDRTMTTRTDIVSLDLRGLRCPMPLLKLKQALHKTEAGGQMVVLTSDTGAQRDIPAFLRQSQHTLLSTQIQADGTAQFVIAIANER